MKRSFHSPCASSPILPGAQGDRLGDPGAPALRERADLSETGSPRHERPSRPVYPSQMGTEPSWPSRRESRSGPVAWKPPGQRIQASLRGVARGLDPTGGSTEMESAHWSEGGSRRPKSIGGHLGRGCRVRPRLSLSHSNSAEVYRNQLLYNRVRLASWGSALTG
jgi:hypothetical protein